MNLTISYESQSYTEFNNTFCIRKYCQLFTRVDHQSVCHFPIVNNRMHISKNARNHARNSPFLFRHVDFHLTDECLGPSHAPRQMTARSLYALAHNDATTSPLVTMGLRKFTPKLPLPFDVHHKNLIQPYRAKRHPDPISHVATAQMRGPTDGTSESSIT